jgi:hypothetical protein
MMTLGLDVSWTNTGIVVLRNGDPVYRDLVGTESKEGKHTLDPGYRLEVVRAGVLRALVAHPKIKRVGIEGYARGKLNKREEMGEVTGIVKHLLWKHGYPYILCAPQALKKWALGEFVTGDKGKEMMLRAAREEGLATFDHNVADAFWMARWTDANWPYS